MLVVGVVGGTQTATVAGASPQSNATDDPVADAISTPGALDSLNDVRTLAALTDEEPGVTVGVVVDTNGIRPGGISVERIQSPGVDVDSLIDSVAEVPGVITAAVDVPISLASDPLSSSLYHLPLTRTDLLPSDLDGLGTVVAVVDTGVAAWHADLAAPLRNGGLRVLPGQSFVRTDGSNGGPGNFDPHGHGTHVAGIVAAARDNGLGVRGVAPGARILPVRVIDAAGQGSSIDFVAGILWAHQQGADVISVSLSGDGSIPLDVAAAINTVTTTVALGASAPAVVVASAGNGGVGGVSQWPANHPPVIAVAATDSSDAIASFSTRGSYIDLAAPGASILSTCIDGGYCLKSGTSMSAPMVAASVALLRQQVPSRTPAQIAELLRTTAVDIGTPGFDTMSGAGRIDVAQATGTPVPAPPTTAPPTTAPPTTAPPTPAPPTPIPQTKVAPPPVPVSGGIDIAVLDRRRYAFGGWAVDPNGPAVVRVLVANKGNLRQFDQWNGGDRWGVTVDLAPGDNLICAWGIDNPTNTVVLLGCRGVTVK